jgi:Xaa-Pro aminopeptidase
MFFAKGGCMMRVDQWRKEAVFISEVLKRAPSFDREYRIGPAEFKTRQEKVLRGLKEMGLSCGVVFSNEHYNGDVPYLGGNTNITVESVAGIIGHNGFHILAGLEGGYVAEQLASRSNSKVHKIQMLQLADEDYPIEAERFEDVIEEACDGKPDAVGLLTPRAIIPVSLYEFLAGYLGNPEKIIDAQEVYYRVKYEKSDTEMKLIEESCLIADTLIEGMVGVLKPGMYDTQVAGWGYGMAYELGVDELSFDIIVTTGEANRSLISKALNYRIEEGDIVSIGVAPRRDGLTGCNRVSVVAVDRPAKVTDKQKYWIDFVEEAYQVGLDAYVNVSRNNLPAKLVEQAIVDFFKKREEEVNRKYDIKIDLARQKPYTGVHNAGYTEAYEFYGAITLSSENPLGNQIVNMLDIAIRGIGNKWDEVKIPGLDYVVVEKTIGKYGRDARVLNKLPVNVQHLVGRA